MQQKDKYADMKFNQGLTTIRNRISHLSASNNFNNSSTSYTVRTAASNNNMQNKVASLNQDCSYLLEAVKQSVYQVKGIRQKAKILEENLKSQLEIKEKELLNSLKMFDRNFGYQKLQSNKRVQRCKEDCQRITEKNRQLKSQFLSLRGRIQIIQNCLGLAKINK